MTNTLALLLGGLGGALVFAAFTVAFHIVSAQCSVLSLFS